MIKNIVIPLLIFVAVVVIGFWVRFYLHKFFKRQQQSGGWIHSSLLIESVWHPIILWFILLGAFGAIQFAKLSHSVRTISGEALASVFVISIMWVAVDLSGNLIGFYAKRAKETQTLTSIAYSVARIVIVSIGILVILEIWGAPTLPLVIVICGGLIVVGIAFRNTFDNIIAGIEIAYGKQIEVGHFISLDSGQTGYITQISWSRTIIRTPEGATLIIPNSKLMASTIVNYGANYIASSTNVIQSDTGLLKPDKNVENLSDREREVLSLIGKGATNREIAETLIISEHTVKSHLRSILNKLNLRNRQQAAVYAEREGLIVNTTAPKTES
jgi:small-conductance mechanosensitive channel/DNA-binding CsgD family transcriptional regulator